MVLRRSGDATPADSGGSVGLGGSGDADAPAPTVVRLGVDELEELCDAAIRGAGGSGPLAASLARATVAADVRGRHEVGAAHLLDYLDALTHGRLNGEAHPRVISERPAALIVDADEGTAQAAFELVADDLLSRARESGTAVLSVRNCFAAGEIGYYTARFAEAGMVALACSNSPALMAVHGATEAITGTNPMSFALPHPSGPRMFDQASSASAFVSIRTAAESGEPIPEGWALDSSGEPTTDPAAALAGTLLPFGSSGGGANIKAGNIALMVEMLAALGGGLFSDEAAPFDSGSESPRLGLFVLAVDPNTFDPGYAERAEARLQALADDHGADFGRRKPRRTAVEIPTSVIEALRAAAARTGGPGAGPNRSDADPGGPGTPMTGGGS